MSDAKLVEWIGEKYNAITADLDERGRRRWAAAEARSLGWGGVTAVSAAMRVSDRTIRNGIVEIDSANPVGADRQRQKFKISSTKVGQLLRSQGFGLQANHKSTEGKTFGSNFTV